jgi:hypothetical protein
VRFFDDVLTVSDAIHADVPPCSFFACSRSRLLLLFPKKLRHSLQGRTCLRHYLMAKLQLLKEERLMRTRLPQKRSALPAKAPDVRPSQATGPRLLQRRHRHEVQECMLKRRRWAELMYEKGV